jgi:hypothetical protein
MVIQANTRKRESRGKGRKYRQNKKGSEQGWMEGSSKNEGRRFQPITTVGMILGCVGEVHTKVMEKRGKARKRERHRERGGAQDMCPL